MPDVKAPPFHSFSFTLIDDRQPRCALRMRVSDADLYELHIEKGSAANPSMQFTRTVPTETAERLRDALQEIGVFGWDESYGDDPSRIARRWTVSTVFKEGVFTVVSRGGSAVPAGFDQLLDELYRLDFPRPNNPQSGGAPRGVGSAINSLGLGSLGSIGGMSAGDIGAYSTTGNASIDPSRITDLFKGGDIPGLGDADMSDLLADIQRNPQALQQRMRDEFRHMSSDEQNRMLDALAATGMASRAWWERFLRGY